MKSPALVVLFTIFIVLYIDVEVNVGDPGWDPLQAVN